MRNTILKIFLASSLLLTGLAVRAQQQVKYVDAQSLTHLGKLIDTPNPYDRVEVEKYPELNNTEARLLRFAAGESIVFETNSPEIWVKARYGVTGPPLSMPMMASCGFNLYIERDGEWLWAASNCNRDGKDKEGNENMEKPLNLIKDMNAQPKRCLLYLPLFAELTSLEIGVAEGSEIKAMTNPFRHKIAIFGSSFTHGASATCAGQIYASYLQRMTGLDISNFGMSGNSKLQRVMGEILAGTDAEAFICDAFSNPTPEIIGERLRPFIEAIRAKHPHTPIIFLRTIYRERRNFDLKTEAFESGRIAYAERLLKEMMSEFDDIYYISVSDQTGTDHQTSADGTHPSSWGHERWARSIRKPIMKILARYGIK